MVKEELSQGQNANERNPREKVSQGLAEKTKVSLEGIEDFPRQKEVGLCLLKIKELTNIETDTLNQEDPKETKQYQYMFFHTYQLFSVNISHCMSSPGSARGSCCASTRCER